MSLSQRGQNISPAITDISPDGIWLLYMDEEFFLAFDQFPWFRKGSVEQILNIVEERPGAFHWPDLDIDLGIESIRYPDRYALKASGT